MTNFNNQLDSFFRQAELDSETDMSEYAAHWLAMEGILVSKPGIIGKSGRWNPGVIKIVITIFVATVLVVTLLNIRKSKLRNSTFHLDSDTNAIQQVPTPKPLPNADSGKGNAVLTNANDEGIPGLSDTVPPRKTSLNKKLATPAISSTPSTPTSKSPSANQSGPSTHSAPSTRSIRFQQTKDTALVKNPDSPSLTKPVRTYAAPGELRVLEEARQRKTEKFDFDTAISLPKPADSIRIISFPARKKTSARSSFLDTPARRKKDSYH